MEKTNSGIITPGGRQVSISLKNPPSTEADLKDSGGDQLLLNQYTSMSTSERSIEKMNDLNSLCLKLTEENKSLHDRIRTLEVRLASVENQKIPYHSDEDEFTTPQNKKPETTKGPYDWVIHTKKYKKRKASNLRS